jgi:hypothetical protein
VQKTYEVTLKVQITVDDRDITADRFNEAMGMLPATTGKAKQLEAARKLFARDYAKNAIYHPARRRVVSVRAYDTQELA